MKPEIPVDPRKRRVIVPLESGDYEWVLHGNDKEIQVPTRREGVLAVPLGEYVDTSDPLLQRLEEQGLLRPGNVLIQSPFAPDMYEREEDSVISFHLVRLGLVSELCQILGATTVKSDVKTFRMEKEDSQGKMTLGRPGIKGEATLRYIKSEEAKASITLHDSFPGAEPNIEQARAFLRDYGLSGHDLRSLVDMRERGNPVKQRKLTVSTSVKGDRNLELAGKIEIPIVKIGVDFKRNRQYVQSFSQEVQIDFKR